MTKNLKIIIIIGAILIGGVIGLTANTWGFDINEFIKERIKSDPCLVCSNGCDTCPEGCEECLIGIGKKEKDPNMKWYYNPDNFNGGNRQVEIETGSLK